LGNESDFDDYSKEINRVKFAIDKDFYDKDTGDYCFGEQGANAFALKIGLGDERTKKNLVTRYRELKKFDTGIFGTDILIRVLCENGYKDLARKLLTSEKENTFYNMKKHGATTLWENWNGEASHSHPMFGAVVQYIVNYFNEV
jgi:alpha-L-rhamnosidase